MIEDDLLKNINNIKLIIWDLDETFWEGTISEEKVTIPSQSILLLEKCIEVGIMNSICSKNDFDVVKKQLEDTKIFDKFVFPSVNWEAKGRRIKQIISDMQLRDKNVLFIDDNSMNLEEAKYYSPNIMIAKPDIIQDLYTEINKIEKKDNGKRLKQYKILETKKEKKQDFESNEAFLMDSNIQVDIVYDCLTYIDRIHELLMRSNQLNYTKDRIGKEELLKLLKDDTIEKAAIFVKDKYGDYGLSGFYAVKENKLIHFFFSCRILGMGIEYYIYNILKRPKLDVKGEVISDINKTMSTNWINHSEIIEKKDNKINDSKILVKGPCDLSQLFYYIKSNSKIDEEYTYISEKNGVSIESANHTMQIVESYNLSNEQKQEILNDCIFADENMFSKKIFTKKYDIIFLSMLTDCNLGVYKKKGKELYVAFGEYYYSLTSSENWDGYINGTIFNANCKFTKEYLKEFSEKYEFVGRITKEQLIKNLQFIRENIDKKTILVLNIGSEREYKKNNQDAYKNRHLVHKEMNEEIRRFVEKNRENCKLIEFDNYIKGQEDFYDNINHLTKNIYYKMAMDVINLIQQCSNAEVKNKSKIYILRAKISQRISSARIMLRKVKNKWKN